ncbi:TlpA disulfide reductase family protein [Chitinophaga sp.]|uniref:TlpA disulfide reductase family protein n=1 Tax=Chitinophaga sp. TaxID=1869181 RepID=UPI0026188B42|nr:TlpA disulfide reductase family protein [uncultured Chitinophaga sp.]
MKRCIQIAACCLLALPAFAQEAVVEGNIKGLPDGTKIYLRSFTSSGGTDSAVAKGGAFRVRTNAAEGDMFILSAGNDRMAQNSSTFFYLEPGVIKISGKGPLLKEVAFAGPAYAKDLNTLQALNKLPLFQKRMEVATKMNEAYKVKDTVTLKALQGDYNKLDSASRQVYEKWVDEHKASPVSAMVLSFHLRYKDMDELEKRLKALAPSAKENAPAKKLLHSVEAAKATAIGKVAPEFTQNDTLDKPVSLKDFRGKYVLIDFWASWCVPCRHENPAVVKAFQQYKDKNFTVLGVSLDRQGQKDKWLKAIHDDNLTWTHVSDLNWWDNAVSRQYDIRSIPANFLLDPQGRIIGKNLRGEALEKKLAEVLN